jgi:hypothetical protein
MIRPNGLLTFGRAAVGALTGARTLGATNFVGALTGARTGAFRKLCSNADLLSGKNTFPSNRLSLYNLRIDNTADPSSFFKVHSSRLK